MSEEFSYFQLGSGLPLAGQKAQCIKSEFIVDNSYAAGATVWAATWATEENLAGSGEPQVQLYSVGKNFEPVDFGQRLQHSSGKNVRINGQSIYGKWITAAISCDGAPAFMAEAQSRGLEPDSAGLWVGMWFDLDTQDYKDMAGKDKTMIVPAKYHGVSEVAGVTGGGVAPAAAQVAAAPGPGAGPRPGPAAAPAPAAAPGGAPAPSRTMPPRPGATTAPSPAPSAPSAAPTPAPAPSTFSGSIDGVDQTWVDWAIGMAQANTDYETFMAACLDQEGVNDMPLLQRAIMSQKPGSLWATHHG